MELRRLQKTDLKAFLYLYIACFVEERDSDPNSLVSYFNNILKNEIGLGLFDGGEIVGIGLLTKHSDSTMELDTLAVREEYRNKGYGFRIAEAICAIADCDHAEISLLVPRRHANAIQVYESLGFVQFGHERGAYVQMHREPFAHLYMDDTHDIALTL